VLLEDLRRQERSPAEVVVVDAGSTDRTAEVARTYTISHYKLSFWAAASAQRGLAAAVRARPPAGRARPSPLHIKKALASKWYYPSSPCLQKKPVMGLSAEGSALAHSGYRYSFMAGFF
jgi:glycosyltransferase involved in cell wall biosynthesis